ncbi:DNA primase family protein [Arthrobacter sp. SA17]
MKSKQASRENSTDGNLATVTDLAERPRKPRPDLITRSLDRSDDGNALALIDHYGEQLKFNPERGRWLTWNGSIWEYQPASGGLARECAKTIARSLPETDSAWKAHKRHSLSANGIANMLRQAETDPSITVRTEQLDAHPWELNTPDGIINLRLGELSPADPAKLHTRRTAFTPDFNADAMAWNKFLTDTFPDRTLSAFMQRLTGYSAIGEVTAHILPFCYGSGGNGKSAFLETIIAVLGDYATTSPSGFLMASNYSQHSTEIARLAGQRLVVCSEVNESDRFDEAKVKQLTGGDRLTARFMRQDAFTFKPAHTLWLAGNFQPAVESGGEGFWRRIRQIPFTQTVPAEQRIEGLVEHLVGHHGPGILAWIVRGAAIYAANGLQEPDMVRTATQQYAEDVDTVGLFLEDACIQGAAASHMSVPVATLRNAYEKWCADCGETPLKGRAFTAQLVRHGVEAGRTVTRKGAGGARLYGRIGLVDRATIDTHDGDRGGY